jgi:CO dehydrogenase/acetyl-CoA synthase beta subunit
MRLAAFDECIARVAEVVAELRAAGGPVQEFDFPGEPEELWRGLPVAVGSGANPGIILRGDTFLELGNPEAGSSACLLWTDDPSRIRDGRITLFGPGIQGSGGASLPFGQIVMAAGEGLVPEDHEKLQQAQHVADQIEGYMVRSTSENVWSRVSREAAGKGLDFAALGRALMGLVKAGAPGVSAVQIVFVTRSKADVRRLDDIASKARQIGSDLLKETWKARGYDLDCDFDCASCVDQSVCDDIRDVIQESQKKKAG